MYSRVHQFRLNIFFFFNLKFLFLFIFNLNFYSMEWPINLFHRRHNWFCVKFSNQTMNICDRIPQRSAEKGHSCYSNKEENKKLYKFSLSLWVGITCWRMEYIKWQWANFKHCTCKFSARISKFSSSLTMFLTMHVTIPSKWVTGLLRLECVKRMCVKNFNNFVHFYVHNYKYIIKILNASIHLW